MDWKKKKSLKFTLLYHNEIYSRLQTQQSAEPMCASPKSQDTKIPLLLWDVNDSQSFSVLIKLHSFKNVIAFLKSVHIMYF